MESPVEVMKLQFYIVIRDGNPAIEELTAEEAQGFVVAGGPFQTREEAQIVFKKAFPPMQWR
jgi:hypothetical protein